MQKRLEEYLDNDERLLWQRLPGRGGLLKALRTVQIIGHIFLTLFSVFIVMYLPMTVTRRAILCGLLILTTNAPLIIWGKYRLPRIKGGGDAVFFITDQRIGLLRPEGEIRQVPVCPGLSVQINSRAAIVEFSLGERTPVCFGGLKKEEILLVSSVAEGLIKRCG